MRIATLLLLFVILPLAGCLKPLPNDPQLLAQFQQRPQNLMLEFTTEQGRQVAYYLPPMQAPDAPPQRIAILYPGINSLALGWLRFINLDDYPTTAYLLIDYPGRGLSAGGMRPEENYRNSLGALKALAEHFGVTQLAASLSLLGHSFGTGAALQFACLRPVERVVLVAPFNDLKQAVRRQSWLLSLLMPSQIDNRQLIRQLLAEPQPPQIIILHGGRDTTLPIAMGRELAQLDPEKIVFHAFAEDDHVDILTRRRKLIFQELNGKVE